MRGRVDRLITETGAPCDGNVACVVLVEALDVAVALGACLALLLDCRKEKHNAL